MSTSIDLLSFSPPPSSMLSRTQFSFTHKPTFLLSSKKESFFTLRASAADNGAGVSAPAVTVEEPKVREASEGPTESNGAVEAPEVKAVNKFEDPKWVNGTWDLKQFQKNGQTDWDAVIDAEARRRKWLENSPESSSNDDPVIFDTSIVPWWAWIKRFHLPEAELLNGVTDPSFSFSVYLYDASML
ncbi:hypothetical protein CISIN_1g025671mg [Citrus sinensis]|uniref:Uncharacterized protein n=1 Tax=Citrus sinensis TaxID=2711 RepID=A0A067EPC5_CITSI|nr:hypothetical protein CISIN_1g025671mg [Citrus sinensis]